MRGGLGALRVLALYEDPSVPDKVVWEQRSSGQYAIWRLARVDMMQGGEHEKPFRLVFEALISGKWQNLDEEERNAAAIIAIDDVSFEASVCESPGRWCDFERDMCGWCNDVAFNSNKGAALPWHRSSGRTMRGPSVDNTLGTELGWYALLDMSSTPMATDQATEDSDESDDQTSDELNESDAFGDDYSPEEHSEQHTRLVSEVFKSEDKLSISSVCVTFYYFVSEDVNDGQYFDDDEHSYLKLYGGSALDDEVTDELQWSELGETRGMWHNAKSSVRDWSTHSSGKENETEAEKGFVVVFEASRRANQRSGYVALDDISIVAGMCQSSAQTIDDLSTVTSGLPTGVCDFEDGGMCGWMNDDEADFEWQLFSGPTKNDVTGPYSDHTKQSIAGHYLCATSYHHFAGEAARLISQPFRVPTEVCSFELNAFRSYLSQT